MEIRQLNGVDAVAFSELVINMYSHLDNLEWFTPMPFDIDSVSALIESPRFYIVGAFIKRKLVGVSSLDYKCGKLIGKIDFPDSCNTDKLVEIGFNLVHFDYRGNKIMQQLLSHLLTKIKTDFEWVFVKIHQDNIASIKSCLNMGFQMWCYFTKSVNKENFINLSSQSFFSPIGKINAKNTLNKFKNSKDLAVDYKVFIQKLN